MTGPKAVLDKLHREVKPSEEILVATLALSSLQPGDVVLDWPKNGPRGGAPTRVLIGRIRPKE